MDAVTRLFPGPANRRTTRVGLEQELLTRDAETGAAVAPERVRSATSGASYAASVGFEPGGQVELSLSPARDGRAASRQLRATAATLRGDCARAGIVLDASPVDTRTPAEVPLRLTSQRYVAMQAHFDSLGPAGRRMMRCTASTQVCLDWWPGRAGLEQWRVLLLAGPYLAATYNRSFGRGSRLDTWLAVDPGRTGFDDRLLRGEDPVAAYAGFAAGATRFMAEEEHLSTLFPPVRPRGRYLEVRFLDVQPEERVGEVVAALSGLLYDDDRRRRVLAGLGPAAPRLAELWRAATDGDLEERAVA
jgi:gamma-glutamylcysteine synthetase